MQLWHLTDLHIRNSRRTPRRMLKKSVSKAAGESKPEAYPLGYVEDFGEPRTPLAGFFSILREEAVFFEIILVYHRSRLGGNLSSFLQQTFDVFPD